MDNSEYILINSNDNKIIYCSNCNMYIIYIKESSDENYFCNKCGCSSIGIQNVFIDEAKIYFNPKQTIRRYIGGNYSNIERQHYSWKYIRNVDNE